MDGQTKNAYFRMVYARALRYLGGALVLAAVVGGLYQSRLYFVFACCAFGFSFLCWAWFSYMRQTGLRVFGFRPEGQAAKTPYVHRKDKEQRPHRPSFAMDNMDFDDDLVRATTLDEELFDERRRGRARALARAACGVLLILVSFAVRTA